MNIVVLGAGAVGGYFGGRLAKSGVPVSFLVRPKRFEQLKKTGLVVRSVHGDFTVVPALATDPKEIENPELVILGLKNYHLEGAIEMLKSLVAKGAKVLPLLNGVEHIERLQETLGKGAVLGGSCYIESTLNSDGEIVQTSPVQDIVFGSLTGQDDQAFLQEVETLLNQAEIPVKLSNEIIKEMWTKYAFLASFSAITASTRQPIGVALNDPVTVEFLRNLIVEVCDVARSQGIQFPEDLADQLVKRMKGLSPSMTASMHRDLEKGEPMELDSLHGALLKMAEAAGIRTPIIQSVYALLHPYKNGKPSL